MKQKQNVNNLLSGFFAGKLTLQEKSNLYDYLTDEGYKDEIIAWLQAQWAKNHWQTGGEIPSETMLEKIRCEIEEHAKISSRQPTGQKIRMEQQSNVKSLRIFLRYAAVLLFAFGLSWIMLKMITTSVDMEIVAGSSHQYNEIYVPYGSKTKVILPDSSTVWLNAGTRLKYPVIFNSNPRHVFLDGEGFFEVTADRRNPFIVFSNGMNINVFGTKFNVMANADDPVIETTLVEGAIEIQWSKNEAVKQSDISLKPGQKLTLHKEKEQYEIQNMQEEEVSIAWMENKLVFDRERFGDIKIKLERWYGVTIEVNDPEILDYQITGTFEKQTLEQAMEALSIAISYNYTIDKNHVIVSK